MSCLLAPCVSGYSRVPEPPARMIPRRTIYSGYNAWPPRPTPYDTAKPALRPCKPHDLAARLLAAELLYAVTQGAPRARVRLRQVLIPTMHCNCSDPAKREVDARGRGHAACVPLHHVEGDVRVARCDRAGR